ALFFVARREAPLGIVYATDAIATKDVRIVARFPEDSHPPIVYPIALTAASANPSAAAFAHYLESSAARPFFEKQGFTPSP
ncbi:MAG TPA: extracellular solute-binding protein, partial [Stellaceae bacterium]|nr:extracellular solute-binding protein [Stellaceae bacterium]